MTGPVGAVAKGVGATTAAAACGAGLVLLQAASPSAVRARVERTFTRIDIPLIGGPRPQGFLEKPLHVVLEGLP
jgi:hypothetical protein